jgi:hypothetical protein
MASIRSSIINNFNFKKMVGLTANPSHARMLIAQFIQTSYMTLIDQKYIFINNGFAEFICKPKYADIA